MAAVIPSPLACLDYRVWLKDAYEARKQESAFFSYRFMALRLEIDAGQLVKILQGKLHLPERAVPKVVKLFSLDGREADYLQELVAFAKSRSRKETAESFNRLMDLKGLDARTLEDRHAAYYLDWRHTVVRSLIGIATFRGDYEALGRLCDPPLSEDEARRSVELLESLDLVARDEKGVWRLKSTHVVQGSSVPRQAVRKFQADVLQLAERALNEVPPEEREISTQTVAVSASDLPVLRGWVADFWRQVQLLAQGSLKPDRICHVGVMLFPAARIRRSRRS
jgi:uncharacterized protein (TIGR02147 family)